MDREIARLSTLSADEILAAVAATDAPRWLRFALGALVRPTSRRLARRLVAFDADIVRGGLSRAAASFVALMGARVTVRGVPPRGAALVVMNHPGAYDALAAMVAVGRDDVLFVAKDRRFLRALPNLHAHLAFTSVAGVKQALRHLEKGGVVVQLGAGAIEPDARFTPGAQLASWPAGSGLLAAHALRLGAEVVPAFVSGVHSPRAKRLRLVRWAESRDITTLGPLLQATLPSFRDVEVGVRFGAAIPSTVLLPSLTHEARTTLLRDAVAALTP